MRQRSGSVGFGFPAVCAMVVLAWGCQSVPEPSHKIVSQENGYEIREYEGYVVAEVVMPGHWREALYGGFRVRAIPPHKTAVLRYGGWTNADKVMEKTEKLRAMLARDGWKPASEFRSAQYNPPWTPPPFRRNEIIVEIVRGEP